MSEQTEEYFTLEVRVVRSDGAVADRWVLENGTDYTSVVSEADFLINEYGERTGIWPEQEID